MSIIKKTTKTEEEVNHNLEATAKQLYNYWFVQFDFPDENGKPYKSSGGKMVWNEKLKREIPEGWNDGIFSNIANITMGQSPDGSSYNEEGNGSVFYQGSTDFGVRFPSVRMFTTSPSRFAKQGDILMSVRAPVGAVNIANNDCCIGRGLSAISAKIGSITYIYYVIYYLRIHFDSLNTSGTTFGAITKDDLYNLPVVVPHNRVIELFESICKPIFDKQMKIGLEIERLTKLRDELLPLLMNGQVSVNYDFAESRHLLQMDIDRITARNGQKIALGRFVAKGSGVNASVLLNDGTSLGQEGDVALIACLDARLAYPSHTALLDKMFSRKVVNIRIRQARIASKDKHVP